MLKSKFTPFLYLTFSTRKLSFLTRGMTTRSGNRKSIVAMGRFQSRVRRLYYLWQNVAKTSTTGWHSISPGMQIFSQELFPAYPNLQIQKKERRPGVDTPALEDWMHNIIMIITLTHNACVITNTCIQPAY